MKIYRWILQSTVSCAATCLLCGQASAAPVFSEDFEGIDVNTSVSTTNSIFTDAVGGGSFVVLNNSVPPLPNVEPKPTNTFTGSKYLQYVDGTGSPLLRAPAEISNTGFILSFDYYEPDRTNASQTALRVILSNGETGTSSGSTGVRAVEINLNVPDGTNATGFLTAIGTGNPNTTFPSNQLVHIDLVGQLGAGTLNYPAGATYSEGSAAQFTYNVYVNGTFAFNAPFRNNHAEITEFALATGTTAGPVQTAYIDNIVLQTVPEPDAFILVGMGLAGLVAFRRHFK